MAIGGWRAGTLVLGLAIFLLPAEAAPIATGSLLVATAKSHDPDFARSVILIIQYDSGSAMGLMLNKPTDVPVSDLLPEAKGKAVPVYAGGPVAIGVRGLLRTKTAPYFSVISKKTELLREISKGAATASFRIYAGYTGWTPRELQSEVARGLWRVVPGASDAIFDSQPGGLWQRLAVRRLQ